LTPLAEQKFLFIEIAFEIVPSSMVASEVQQQQQQQQQQHDQHQQQQDGQQLQQLRKPCWYIKAWQYAKNKPLDLAASTLESITLVLVVFVQDIVFKQSIPICAGLLTASFGLHGLAYKAGQCQVCTIQRFSS
jgi:hypothetical protein